VLRSKLSRIAAIRLAEHSDPRGRNANALASRSSGACSFAAEAIVGNVF